MLRSILVLSFLGALAVVPARAHADATLGPHFGINFDVEDPLIGVEARIDVAHLGSSVTVQIAPSFSYYFTEIDLWNVALTLPFEFSISSSVLRPFVAPGLALAHVERIGDDDIEAYFAIQGGLSFAFSVVEPYVGLRALLGDNSMGELLFGVLFRI